MFSLNDQIKHQFIECSEHFLSVLEYKTVKLFYIIIWTFLLSLEAQLRGSFFKEWNKNVRFYSSLTAGWMSAGKIFWLFVLNQWFKLNTKNCFSFVCFKSRSSSASRCRGNRLLLLSICESGWSSSRQPKVEADNCTGPRVFVFQAENMLVFKEMRAQVFVTSTVTSLRKLLYFFYYCSKPILWQKDAEITRFFSSFCCLSFDFIMHLNFLCTFCF